MPPVPRTWASIAPRFTPRRVARFWARVERRGPDECWPWRGAMGAGGYGSVSLGGGTGPLPAHRFAFAVHQGFLRDDRNVLHSCDNRACVNPAHLREGTHAENMQDRSERGRYSNGAETRTHCKRGHLYPPFAGYGAGQQRACDECLKAWKRREARLQREAIARRRREAITPFVPDAPEELFEVMDVRDAAVLISNFALYGAVHMRLEEIGQRFGLTCERVRQLRNRALRKLGAVAVIDAIRRDGDDMVERGQQQERVA